jgi:hypothetical protein
VDLNISQPDVANCITGVETSFLEQNLDVFPNPANGLFTLKINTEVPDEKLKIIVHNMNGQKVFSEKFPVKESSYKKQIDLTGFPAGLYLLYIYSKKHYYKAELILK